MPAKIEPCEIELWFSGDARPELDRTCFRYPGDPEVNAVRGKDTGAYPGTYATFQWTRTVQALVVFLLQRAEFALRGTQNGSATPPEFKGERGTLAATLSNAISKKTRWLTAIFGGKRVDDVLASCIKRSNADFKRSGPVVFSLSEQLLPAANICVNWHDKRIRSSSELTGLLDRLLRSLESHADLQDGDQECIATEEAATTGHIPPTGPVPEDKPDTSLVDTLAGIGFFDSLRPGALNKWEEELKRELGSLREDSFDVALERARFLLERHRISCSREIQGTSEAVENFRRVVRRTRKEGKDKEGLGDALGALMNLEVSGVRKNDEEKLSRIERALFEIDLHRQHGTWRSSRHMIEHLLRIMCSS